MLSLVTAAHGSPWHHPLYRAGDGYWHQRIPITIHNDTETELAGRPVRIEIGQDAGKLKISGFYEYLYLLRQRITRAKAAGQDVASAERTLEQASELVTIPNAGGRYSSKILPDPDAVLRVRQSLARAIENFNDVAARSEHQ